MTTPTPVFTFSADVGTHAIGPGARHQPKTRGGTLRRGCHGAQISEALSVRFSGRYPADTR